MTTGLLSSRIHFLHIFAVIKISLVKVCRLTNVGNRWDAEHAGMVWPPGDVGGLSYLRWTCSLRDFTVPERDFGEIRWRGGNTFLNLRNKANREVYETNTKLDEMQI